MKNKGVIITMIIVLVLIVVALIVFMCMGISGNMQLGTWHLRQSNEVIFDTDYQLEKISKLEVLSDAGDVTFEESLDEKVRVLVYGKEDESVEVTENEGVLRVDGSHHKNTFFGNHYINDIRIYLPQSFAGQIAVDMDYGNVKSIDFENASMEIDSDCGNIDLGKIKNISVKSDYGNVTIEEVLNRLSIESDCGDVRINSVKLAENSQIESDLGSVKIGQTNEIFIDATNDLGDIKVNHNYRQSEVTLKIINDCGDIKVEN